MSYWIHKAEARNFFFFPPERKLCFCVGFKNRLLLILSLTILIMSNLQWNGGEDWSSLSYSGNIFQCNCSSIKLLSNKQMAAITPGLIHNRFLSRERNQMNGTNWLEVICQYIRCLCANIRCYYTQYSLWVKFRQCWDWLCLYVMLRYCFEETLEPQRCSRLFSWKSCFL